jgi:type II secretory pathway pseudopilin PulG
MNSPHERNRHHDNGETLIEVLAAIIILGTAIAALLAGLGSAVLNSSRHRDLATGNALLRGYAEAVKQSTRAGYVNCATTYNVSSTSYTLPAGWAVPTNAVAVPAGCSGANDPGTQQVTITIVTPKNVSQSLDIWVRKP